MDILVTYNCDILDGCLAWLAEIGPSRIGPEIRAEFRFLIHGFSWAGFELQNAGPGRVGWKKLEPCMHVSKSNVAIQKSQKSKIYNFKTVAIFDFTIKIFNFFT